MSEAIDDFVAQAQRAVAHERLYPFKVRGFGSQPELSERILNVIRRGEKTGTFALAADFAAQPEQRPEPGDIFVVTRHDGVPALIIRIDRTETMPFRDIDAIHTAHEGAALRDPQAWRAMHRAYWTEAQAARGEQFSEDLPVIFQTFTLLYPVVA
ncbi:MAG: ASCH domain-containing protein [Steroidobacteraceae bacterium]